MQLFDCHDLHKYDFEWDTNECCQSCHDRTNNLEFADQQSKRILELCCEARSALWEHRVKGRPAFMDHFLTCESAASLKEILVE